VSVSLYANSRLIRQVVAFTVAAGVMLISYELVGAVMIGTHELVSFDRYPEVAARLSILASEWGTSEQILTS
jgi:hypothetical protein